MLLATNSLYQAQAGSLGNVGKEHATKLEVVEARGIFKHKVLTVVEDETTICMTCH
jgi:hypothetical protein